MSLCYIVLNYSRRKTHTNLIRFTERIVIDYCTRRKQPCIPSYTTGVYGFQPTRLRSKRFLKRFQTENQSSLIVPNQHRTATVPARFYRFPRDTPYIHLFLRKNFESLPKRWFRLSLEKISYKKINNSGPDTRRVSGRTASVSDGLKFMYTYINYSPVSRLRVVYEARPSATCMTTILFSDSFCVRGSCSLRERRTWTPECTRTRGFTRSFSVAPEE